jgi:hypothetical protein
MLSCLVLQMMQYGMVEQEYAMRNFAHRPSLAGCFDPEDRHCKFFRNVGELISDYMALRPREQ